jgi:hypothetical protein
MVAVATLGDPSAAPPEAADSVSVKLRVPDNGVELLTATVNVLAVVSPAAQLKVPLLAV